MSASTTCQSQHRELPVEGEKLDGLTYVAFDVETTGLSPIACRVVELCGVKFTLGGGQIETFSSLINPGQPIPAELTALHGITDQMVADAPDAGQALAKFFQWIGGEKVVMIAHNASFDVEFIKVEAGRAGLTPPGNLVVDSLFLAQTLVNDSANYKLKTLTEYFGFAGSLYHRALDDSAYVQKLFLKLIEISGYTTLGELKGSYSPFGIALEVSGRDRLNAASLGWLGLLEGAMASGDKVRITYESEFKSTRLVLPKSVIDSRGSLYLHAFCLKSQAERTFRVDRITRAVVESKSKLKPV